MMFTKADQKHRSNPRLFSVPLTQRNIARVGLELELRPATTAEE